MGGAARPYGRGGIKVGAAPAAQVHAPYLGTSAAGCLRIELRLSPGCFTEDWSTFGQAWRRLRPGRRDLLRVKPPLLSTQRIGIAPATGAGRAAERAGIPPQLLLRRADYSSGGRNLSGTNSPGDPPLAQHFRLGPPRSPTPSRKPASPVLVSQGVWRVRRPKRLECLPWAGLPPGARGAVEWMPSCQ
jgi:hypothetical protein